VDSHLEEDVVVYEPEPIDTSKVQLNDEIFELTEILAKNAHEVWAEQRKAKGWRYGNHRDDARKEHPSLVPYEDLSEEEKEYDRRTAMETLKVMLALGYRIEKRPSGNPDVGSSPEETFDERESEPRAGH